MSNETENVNAEETGADVDKKHRNPLQSIKQFCKHDCCCGDREAWQECTVKNCTLWPYRTGNNPFRKKREMTEEQRQATADRLAEARNKKK